MKSSQSPPHPAMKILCIGAGAIGSYVGGSLAVNGHTVIFLERPHNVETLHRHGLALRNGPQQLFTVPALAISDPGAALEHGPFDVAIFALKSYDTFPALETLAPFAKQLPPFLCLQNGVENETLLAATLGAENVIPGTVTTAVSRQQPGQVTIERLRGVGIAGRHPLIPALMNAMDQAALQPVHYEDPAAMKWSKLLTNLTANAISAILDLTPAEIYAHPGLFRLELAMLREALAVMTALGIPAKNLPGTPAAALAFAVRYLPIPLAQPLLRQALGRGRGDKLPSFHIDLHSGRGRSEVGYLNGAVVRAGERINLPTPVNQHLTRTLEQLTLQPSLIPEFRKQPAKLLRITFPGYPALP